MTTHLPRGKLLALCLLALLPGCCFTQALWDDGEDEREPVERLAVVRTETFELVATWTVVAGAAGERRIAVQSAVGADRDGVAAWQLVSTSAEEAGAADVALALLAAPDPATAPAVRIEVTRDREQGDLTFSEARLVLEPKFDPTTFGQAVAATALPPDVQERLAAAASTPRYAFAAEAGASPSSPLPVRCEHRLRRLDLRRLLPGAPSSPLVFVTALLVDDAWQPWSPSPPAPAPADGAEPAASKSELAQLAAVRAVVLATDGTTQHTFVLRMASAWSWSDLAVGESGQPSHVSYWAFRTAPPAKGASPAGGAHPTDAEAATVAAAVFPLRITEREVTWELVDVSQPIGAKLALTPLALLGDLAVGWLLHVAGLEFCSCDDDDESAERRQQRRNRARRR